MSLLISILHCLHEAQKSRKMFIVASQFEDGMRIERTHLFKTDCIALAYFLQSMDHSKRDVFSVTLSYVTFENSGFDTLTWVLKKTERLKSRNPL